MNQIASNDVETRTTILKHIFANHQEDIILNTFNEIEKRHIIVNLHNCDGYTTGKCTFILHLDIPKKYRNNAPLYKLLYQTKFQYNARIKLLARRVTALEKKLPDDLVNGDGDIQVNNFTSISDEVPTAIPKKTPDAEAKISISL